VLRALVVEQVATGANQREREREREKGLHVTANGKEECDYGADADESKLDLSFEYDEC
jgi:hypothetical protein